MGRILQLTFRGGRPSISGAPTVVRGPIKDRRGLTLAYTEEASAIAVAPPEILDPTFTVRQLNRYLKQPEEEMLERFRKNSGRRYFFLKRQLDNYVADQIMELNLPGVHRERELRRRYPARRLAGNLMGFVGRDEGRALSGLERIYHKVLTEPGRDSHGHLLHLTLDSVIQFRLEQHLGAAFAASGSKRAVGIVMNIQTGEILALANFPNYDPNEYYKTNPFQRANWAIRFNYEPGSTVKIFMAAALLNEKLVNYRERFFCPGTIKLRNVVINCKSRGRVRAHGSLNLEEILQRSCNVGIIKAMQRMKRERLHHYLTGLGFGRKTEILPSGSGETSGYLPVLDQWVESSGYYMPIGQSFSVTPVQLLRAAASVAAGGPMVRPFVAAKITSADGQLLNRNDPEISKNPFSPEVNRAVLALMEKVVSKGTGRGAFLKEIGVAGKTGTAQKATARGYIDKYVASFVGFFPASRPKYGMLILFDEPRGHAGGGSLAAPVFGKVVRGILPVLQAGVQTVKLSNLRLKERPPLRVNKKKLHDFRGLSAREALEIIRGTYGLKVRMRGSGYVFRQLPEPGTPVGQVKEVKLYLDDN